MPFALSVPKTRVRRPQARWKAFDSGLQLRNERFQPGGVGLVLGAKDEAVDTLALSVAHQLRKKREVVVRVCFDEQTALDERIEQLAHVRRDECLFQSREAPALPEPIEYLEHVARHDQRAAHGRRILDLETAVTQAYRQLERRDEGRKARLARRQRHFSGEVAFHRRCVETLRVVADHHLEVSVAALEEFAASTRGERFEPLALERSARVRSERFFDGRQQPMRQLRKEDLPVPFDREVQRWPGRLARGRV
jgi:C4-dicarboxylate-specific signal transduction histidine kinase